MPHRRSTSPIKGRGWRSAPRASAALFVALWLGTIVPIVFGSATEASAYDAKVSWRPVANAAGYRVYVGYDGDLKGTPRDVGKPATDASGYVRAVVTGLPVGPTANFTVAAYTSTGTLSPVSSRLSLAYAVVARVVDTDGDGLLDSEEDKDLDRVKDSTETSTTIADTDGDGVLDGLEVSLGSNPLLASSVPACTGACASSIWIAAENVNAFSDTMKVDGKYANGADNDPAANSLRSKQLFADSSYNALTPENDWGRYDVVLPKSGTWYLWVRAYYPGVPGSNDANSFHVRVDSRAYQRLGNKKDKFRKWHWDGDGKLETGAVKPVNLGSLAAGAHKLYIAKREVVPSPPRIDVIMLTQSATYVPNDVQAVVGLAMSPLTQLASIEADEIPVDLPPQPTTTTSTTSTVPICTSDADCDDGVSCTLDRCEGGICTNAAFDAFCDDGNYCNGIETCDPGDDCRRGTRLTCDDGLLCNGAEWCHPSFGCIEGDAVVCDDGVACTIDACVEEAAGCRVYPFDMACSDANGCTEDRCTTEGCAYDSAAGACDDGLACTAADACDSGTCRGSDTCGSGYVCDAESNACKAVAGDPDRDGLKGDEDPCPLEVRNACAGPVAMDTATGVPVRVNAHPGGAACAGTRVDCADDMWMAEFGADDRGIGLTCGAEEGRERGAEATVALGGGADGQCEVSGVERVFGCDSEATRDLVACSHAGEPGQSLAYRFAIADGRYVVNLLFASRANDGDAGDGSRRFDVVIEGLTELDGLDLTESGGDWGRAYMRAFVVDVRDGLEIVLAPRGGGTAEVSALEVLRLTD
jgi:hypothetical protein